MGRLQRNRWAIYLGGAGNAFSPFFYHFFKSKKIFLYSKYQKRMFFVRLAWLDEMKNGFFAFFDIIRDGLLVY